MIAPQSLKGRNMKVIAKFYSLEENGFKSELVDVEKVEAIAVAFDGCHKIYLIQSEDERCMMLDYGYEIHPLDKLQEIWDKSCPLRFIQTAGTLESVVHQCTEETIRIEIQEA